MNPWRNLIKVHPAADVFPMLSEAEIGELARDIELHGLTNPLSLWRADEATPWQLLDGRNRLEAMSRLVEGDVRIEGALALANHYEASTDPVAFIISANLRRRHLTAEQKRELIAALLKRDPVSSNRAIAALARVDDKTVANVRKGLEDGAEFPHHAERVGRDGVAQPATKPAPRKLAPRERDYEPAPLPKIVPERERRAPGADDPGQPAAAPPARNRFRDADELVQVLTVLRGDRSRIAQIPLAKRVALARGALMALDVTLDQLKPVGGQ